MRSAVLCVVVALAACSPAAALGAGWTASQTRPVHGRIVPLTSVIRDQHAQTEVIEREGTRAFAVPSDVLFAFDSGRVTAAGAASIRQLAAGLEAGSVTVAGHTDKRGSAAYNERLAARRAEAASRVVRAAARGVAVTTEAVGERRPIASNRSAAGRRRNRRVELVVPR